MEGDLVAPPLSSERPNDPADPSPLRTVAGVASLSLAFALYAVAAVPRLTNNLVGDSEFTGWTGPVAERFFTGETPYRDFVLPIPPGAFVVLWLAQRLMGERLLTELVVGAVCHLGMAWLAYAICRPWASRATSLAVAAASLATVVQLYKECAYDHTAQLVVWGAACAGSWGLTSAAGPRRTRCWVVAGALAMLTLGFKQSTGVGAVAGWVGGLALAWVLAAVARRPSAQRLVLADARHFGAGLVLGALGVGLLLLITGSSFTGFLQSAFGDGAELKGGTGQLLQNLVGYLFQFETWPASLGFTAIAAWVLHRIISRDPRLRLGATPPAARGPLVLVGALGCAFFVAAALALSSNVELRPAWLTWAERMKYVPSFGLLVLGLLLAWRLVRGESGEDDGDVDARPRSLVVLGVATLACSLLHNLSSPNYRPFYDNNPIIPVSFLLLLLALEHAALPRLVPAVLVLALGVLFGNKLSYHLEATEPVTEGHWAGLRVGERGRAVVEAARRARELAGDDTVLVLPEDVALARLVGRPRPPIRGAIVFVDQYPRRLLRADLEALERQPPKVVIVHPAKPELWRSMFAIWSTQSAAAELNLRFIEHWLPARYRLDSVHPTRFARTRAELQIWVRND